MLGCTRSCSKHWTIVVKINSITSSCCVRRLVTPIWLLARHNGMDQIDFKIKTQAM
jgi:hypothetical protein